jgi:hypothetical protein
MWVYVPLELEPERKRGVGNAGLPKHTVTMYHIDEDSQRLAYETGFEPVSYKARYLYDIDHQHPETPALVMFSDWYKAQHYIGTELIEEKSIALVYTHVNDLQRRAFKGDPHGLCIVDPPPPEAAVRHEFTGEPLTGLSVEVSKLGEWLAAPEG